MFLNLQYSSILISDTTVLLVRQCQSHWNIKRHQFQQYNHNTFIKISVQFIQECWECQNLEQVRVQIRVCEVWHCKIQKENRKLHKIHLAQWSAKKGNEVLHLVFTPEVLYDHHLLLQLQGNSRKMRHRSSLNESNWNLEVEEELFGWMWNTIFKCGWKMQ